MSKTNVSPYQPALDGIRAISILLVFVGHLGYDHYIPGGFGVTIFFFISGLLITNLLFSEYRKIDTIHLGNFYVRRFLRLYPALLLMLTATSAFLLSTGKGINVSELFAATFYYENYYSVYIGPGTTDFWILWSLAVEEHFYLVFPFLFLVLSPRSKRLVTVTALLIGLSLGLRLYTTLQHGTTDFANESTAYLTHNRFDSILTGCFASMMLNSVHSRRFLAFISQFWAYGLAVVVLGVSLLYRDDFFRQTYRYSVQGFCLLVIIPPIVYSSNYAFLNRLLSARRLVWVGKLSYSIYLFHWLSLMITREAGLSVHTTAWVVCNTLLTFSLSIISYYGVELHFLALRKKFGSHAARSWQSASQPQTAILVRHEEKQPLL